MFEIFYLNVPAGIPYSILKLLLMNIDYSNLPLLNKMYFSMEQWLTSLKTIKRVALHLTMAKGYQSF